MKLFATAIFSIATLACQASFAQSSNTSSSFAGFSAAISLNFPTTEVRVSDTFGNSLGKVSASDTNYFIQVAKGLSLGSNGIFIFGTAAEVGKR
jgi:hypothetical protein